MQAGNVLEASVVAVGILTAHILRSLTRVDKVVAVVVLRIESALSLEKRFACHLDSRVASLGRGCF